LAKTSGQRYQDRKVSDSANSAHQENYDAERDTYDSQDRSASKSIDKSSETDSEKGTNQSCPEIDSGKLNSVEVKIVE
jgi:hypothetical protein